jgi:pyruvate kinase
MKIVATLGPASSTFSMIEALFRAGADVFRLNFSHGTHETHRKAVDIIREVEAKIKRPIGILMDLQGPKLRVGKFEKAPVELQKGQTFCLDSLDQPGDASRVSFPHPEILGHLKPGTFLLLDDGKLKLEVQKVYNERVETLVLQGGMLSDHKGVNIPNLQLPISSLTEKDRLDALFAVEMQADFLALSFVQTPDDLEELRNLVGHKVQIISKIEKPLALEHLDNIIPLSDAIMVARGDLGVEMPPEDVPILQKHIIRLCKLQGKPVIVATQMLESMITNPTPTRAEASDVANAVYDGADAVMLSAESASGDHPLEAVTMMNRILEKTESDPLYHSVVKALRPDPVSSTPDAITAAAQHVANTVSARAIVTFTASGSTSLRASRQRPLQPLVALTPHMRTARKLTLGWGIQSYITDISGSLRLLVQAATDLCLEEEFARKHEKIVITGGDPLGVEGNTNFLHVREVE